MSLSNVLRARWFARLRSGSVVSLLRMACWAALLGLAVMSASIINPMPVTVIFAMSVGHVIGGFAFLCYLLSIIADSVMANNVRRGPDPPMAPGSENVTVSQRR